ncbi:MAG: efflux RND transporter periplasmic adaptor subunit [Ferrimonas sp.]
MVKRIVLVVGSLLLILAALGVIKAKQVEAVVAHMSNYTPPPATVSAVAAEQVDWRPQVRAVGSLNAIADIDVASEVAGVVESIHFDSGQSVTQGQLLLVLNDAVEQADLVSYQAQAELAQVKYKRTEDLFKRNSVSKTEMDQASADLKVANAMVAQTRATIAKKHIRAPFSGTLGIRKFSLGEFINQGQALVSLQDSSVLFADFAVPEQYFPHLYHGQDVYLAVSAMAQSVFHGKVVALESKVDEGTRNIELRAQLDNADGQLRPGMYADIQLLMKESITPWVVPSSAIVYSPFGNAVFEVQADEQGALTAIRRYITIGERRGDLVAVMAGLNANALVVNAGVTKLDNGAAVQLSDAVQL